MPSSTPSVPARQLPDPALRARCTRFLSGHGFRTAQDWLRLLADSDALHQRPDEYGQGPVLQALEEEVAGLLGKPRGLFFHKGVVAQQAALRVHTARSGCPAVAVPPKSHLAYDEEDALQRLSGLTMVRVGTDHRPFGVPELEALREPLGAIVVELPLRRAGFRCLPWEELEALSAWARARRIPLHLDGARLWEAQPWYGRPLGEIAALFDTVYVSFYKGLGGMAGCVLAGPGDVLEATRPWRGRFGGNLFTAFPYVLTARAGLQHHLPRMAEYHARARALAAALGALPGVRAVPEPPHCNSFQLHFDVPAERLEQAAVALAEEQGQWLFSWFQDTALPGTAMAELVVGEATLAWSTPEVVGAVRGLVERARAR